MTRFKTGSKVEVFSTREVASGSWYLAEIIHGNGHYYTIKYEDGAFDRVPRRAIRPCPPPLQVLGWASGDIIEVFHHFSWKMATVLRALQTGWLLVRLLGSSHELEVSEVDARPRVFLHHDQWNVVGKGSSNSGKRQNVPSTSISLKNSYFPCIINNGDTQEVKDGSKSLKRKFKSCYPENGAQNKRVRVKGKYRRRNKQTSTVLASDWHGANSITSSVASCSMSACEIPRNFLSEENDEYNSDAESFCHIESEVVRSDENLSEEIHRIELHGYRSILGALYASGPLSWEQETLLTDLRNSLHITNDEHLMELRSLVSSSS